jgi:branched-chain amino acid transport system ATP-binding protein
MSNAEQGSVLAYRLEAGRRFQRLGGVSLIQEGEVVCLLGPNGAGKSTLISAVSGLVKPHKGRIEFCGERIDGLPTHQIVTRGLSQVMEQRRLFPYLTVEKNLTLGSFQKRARAQRAEPEWVFEVFHPARAAESACPSLSGRAADGGHARGLDVRPNFSW